MNEQKPNKTIYKNQEEIYNKIIKLIKEKYLKQFSRLYLTGSLASKTFGIYDKEYEGYGGSDIDLAGIPKIKIKGRYRGFMHNWYHEYQLGEIEINNIKHPINLNLRMKSNIKQFMDKMKELNKPIKRLK